MTKLRFILFSLSDILLCIAAGIAPGVLVSVIPEDTETMAYADIFSKLMSMMEILVLGVILLVSAIVIGIAALTATTILTKLMALSVSDIQPREFHISKGILITTICISLVVQLIYFHCRFWLICIILHLTILIIFFLFYLEPMMLLAFDNELNEEEMENY